MRSAAWLASAGALVLGASLAAASLSTGPTEPGAPDLRSGPAFTASPACRGEGRPARVVSAALLADELLLDLLPLERWAAASYIVDWPSVTPVSARFPKTLARTAGTSEELLAYRADLVVLSDYNSAAVAAQLSQAGTCVRQLKSAQDFEGLFASWLELGRWVGEPERAEQLVAEASARLARIRAAPLARPRRALLLQGLFGYAEGSLQHACLRAAGLQNALEDSGGGATPALNAEQVLAMAPDLIFVAADVSSPRAARHDELPAGVPWMAVEAVQARRAFAIPAAWMASISQHALLACEAYSRLSHEVG